MEKLLRSASNTPEGKDVQFRFIAVPYESSHLGGFALWYRSREDAEDEFRQFHHYIMSPSGTPRSLLVAFTQDSATTHSLRIDLNYGTTEFRIRIADISTEYVRRLREALRQFPYYFITAGFTDADGQAHLLPPKDFTFFLATVLVDGQRIVGEPGRRWPSELFKKSRVELLDEIAKN